MSVTVFRHQSEAALTLDGVGANGARLIIQTGTIIFDFQGVAGEDWIRDHLRHSVLDLAATDFVPAGTSVKATASAAPASISYSPPAASATVQQGVFAQGNVLLGGFADSGGQVSVSGPVALPVVGGGVGQSTVSILGGGWAVDRTWATRVQNDIELNVDLAIKGPASLLRLAYSLFVTVTPRLVIGPVSTSSAAEP